MIKIARSEVWEIFDKKAYDRKSSINISFSYAIEIFHSTDKTSVPVLSASILQKVLPTKMLLKIVVKMNDDWQLILCMSLDEPNLQDEYFSLS